MLLGVKRSTFRMHDSDSEAADKEYQTIRYDVFQRDEWTCRYCKMKTMPQDKHNYSGGFEIHHADDDHHNNDKDNLETTCPFCHAVFHCGNAGHRESGSIIWAPFIRQEDLNIAVHVLFINISFGKKDNPRIVQAEKAQNHSLIKVSMEVSQRAREQYVLLQELADGAEKELGSGMSNAAVLGEALATLANDDPKAYEQRAAFLYGARFLPDYAYFEKAVDFWRYCSNRRQDAGQDVITPEMMSMHWSQFKRTAGDRI